MNNQKVIIPSELGGISAVIQRPEAKTDKLAILCPGYLDTKGYKHLVSLADELVARGYVVVRFDPTGTWESSGSIADYTTTRYLQDIRDILGYTFKANDYQTILLGGHSRGGSVSILYAAIDPRITQVLGIMPSTERTTDDQRREEWQKNGVRISHRDLPDNPAETKEFRVPFSHHTDRERYDVLASVEKIKVPIILIAGGLDEVVPPSDVKDIYDHANEPKNFLLLPDIGHDYRHHDNEINSLNAEALNLLETQTDTF